MFSKHILYDDLTTEIKNAIIIKHEEVQNPGKDHTLQHTLEKWFEHDFDSWILDKTFGHDVKTRRKHYRLNVELNVCVVETLIESSEDESTVLDFIGQSLNISRGGLYFVYPTSFGLSSIIKVEIDLSSVDSDLGVVEALAMVVRSEKLEKEKYGISIMFSSIYDDSKKNLDLFLLKQLSYYIYSQ